MKKSITLIELLFVVVIIGILAAIAIPNFPGAGIKPKLAEIFIIDVERGSAFEAYFLERGWMADEDAVVADLTGIMSSFKDNRFHYIRISGLGYDPAGHGSVPPSYFFIYSQWNGSGFISPHLVERRIYKNGKRTWIINTAHPWAEYLKNLLQVAEFEYRP